MHAALPWPSRGRGPSLPLPTLATLAATISETRLTRQSTPKARHLYPDARAKTREGDKRPHGFFGALPFPRCAGDPPLAANSAGAF